VTATVKKRISRIVVLALFWAPLVAAQTQTDNESGKKSGAVATGIDYLFNYLNMAGTKSTRQFQPLTQKERNRLYFKTMVNPLGFVKAGFSAGIDQWEDKPQEWEQGASGYGKRFANILGQYSIQRTVTFGLASGLHEDNRYFNSGKTGIWRRSAYALFSSVLARHDDGSRSVSVSQLSGVAAGAFLSRFWQPPVRIQPQMELSASDSPWRATRPSAS
jgi:hypothetical protein